MEKESRGRGRPVTLTPEEREQRRIERGKISNEHHKKTGYASQKKYGNESHLIRIFVNEKFKTLIEELERKTGMSQPRIFLTAVEEKYGIRLHDIDKNS